MRAQHIMSYHLLYYGITHENSERVKLDMGKYIVLYLHLKSNLGDVLLPQTFSNFN